MNKVSIKRVALLFIILSLLCGCENKTVVEEKVDDTALQAFKDKLIAQGVNISKDNGVECYPFLNNNNIPICFGEATITEEDLQNINDDNAYDLLKTYPDVVLYLSGKEHNDDPKYYAFTAAELLKNKYEDVGTVEVYCDHNYYPIIYIKVNGTYYPDDIASRISKWKYQKWMYSFKKTRYAYDNLKDFVKAIERGFSMMDKEDFVTNVIASSYNFESIVNTNSDYYSTITAPDGRTFLSLIKNDIESFIYCNSIIPTELGFPKLSEQEIQSIVDSKDYDSISSKINTLADAICYVQKARMMSDDFDHPVNNDELIGPDTGNIYYKNTNDNFCYTVSGLETLKLNYAQCSASCSLFKYLLKDDYPEIGYIYMRATNGGHAMLYIRSDNDVYYVVNPAQYLCTGYTDNRIRSFLDFDNNAKACSTNLKDLIDELAPSCNRIVDDGEAVTELCTFNYDGIYCLCNFNDEIIFPAGSNPKSWYRGTKVSELEPPHNTDLDYHNGIAKDQSIVFVKKEHRI